MSASRLWQYCSWLSQEVFQRIAAGKEKVIITTLNLPVISSVIRYITPNQLCYLRILAGIVILFLYMRGFYEWLFPIFILAVVLDMIDGPLARSTHRVSEEGKNLDPIADKVLISIPLLAIGVGRFSNQTVFMFVAVEALLVITANYLKPYLRQRFDIPLTAGANALGQTKMTMQSFSIGILLFNPDSATLIWLAEWLIWLGIAFGFGSLLRHLGKLDAPVEPSKRIITIPTLVTLSTFFLMVPAGFALKHEQWLTATVILGWIYFSDVVDGWLARCLNQQTSFGAVLDAIRDHLAKAFVLIWILIRLNSPVVVTGICLLAVAEITIALVSINTAYRCHTIQLVNRYGKLRSFSHYCLIGVLYFQSIGLYALSDSGTSLIFAAMILASLITLANYLRQRQCLIKQQSAEQKLLHQLRRDR